MKIVLILVCIFFSLDLYSQQYEVREVALSPNEKVIVFSCYVDKVLDLFLYNLENDSVARITDSSGLNFDRQYKTNLNWIDNKSLVFISKHNGIAQQYILNIETNTFALESSSFDNEYYLKYSKITNETYYSSSRNGKEPAVFSKKIGGQDEKMISKGTINCLLSSVSPNGEYIAYKEMPIGKTVLISLKDDRKIKLKLPGKNTSITQWSPLSDKFVYRHSYFKGNNERPLIDIKLYDLTNHTSIDIETGIDYIFGGLWSPCDKYFYTLSNKSYLLDINANTKKEYSVIGATISFMNECQSVLFMQKKRIFIVNLLDGKIRSIINQE